MPFDTQQKMGRRLVIFPLPFAGHQSSMFELANILHSKGFSISIIHTRFNSPNPANYPHFDFHFIDDGLLESETSFKIVITLYDTLNNKCVEPFRTCMSQLLLDSSEEERVSCLISDHMWYFPQAVVDTLKVPSIVISMCNLSSLAMFNANFDPIGKDPEELISAIPHLKVKDIPIVDMDVQLTIDEYLAKMVKETKTSKGLIVNTIEELEELSLAVIQQEFRIPILPLGPFHKWSLLTTSQDDYQSALSWLDTQAPDSVLYVSFGTVVSIDQARFLEMARGLANSNHPFLWVVRGVDGLSQLLSRDLLEQVSKRGYIVGWAPQKEVLAHRAVGGFWTHNGWNSTLESICEGVPMICSPCFGDQLVNARYVSDAWKIGLELDKGEKSEDVSKAIRTLMGDKQGQEIRERAVSLKNKAITCIQPGGSSYKHMEDLVNLIMSF